MRDAETKQQLEWLGREIVQRRLSDQEMPGQSQGNWESIGRPEVGLQERSPSGSEVHAGVAEIPEAERQEIAYLNGILSKMKHDSLSGKRQYGGKGQADIQVIMNRARHELAKAVSNLPSKELAKNIESLRTWLLNKNSPTSSERSALNEIIKESNKEKSKKAFVALRDYMKENYINQHR